MSRGRQPLASEGNAATLARFNSELFTVGEPELAQPNRTEHRRIGYGIAAGIWKAMANPLATPVHDDPGLERLRRYAVQNGAQLIRGGRLKPGDLNAARYWDLWHWNAQRSAREYLLCAPDRKTALADEIRALLAFQDAS